MDCSPPGSFVHGIVQARTLEWIAISRGSSPPRDRTYVSCLLHWQVGSLPLAPPGKPMESEAQGEKSTLRNSLGLEFCCCSVTKSCLTLCSSMDCSTQAPLSSTVSQSLLKFTLSNHLILCCHLPLLAFNLSQHQSFLMSSVVLIR